MLFRIAELFGLNENYTNTQKPIPQLRQELSPYAYTSTLEYLQGHLQTKAEELSKNSPETLFLRSQIIEPTLNSLRIKNNKPRTELQSRVVDITSPRTASAPITPEFSHTASLLQNELKKELNFENDNWTNLKPRLSMAETTLTYSRLHLIQGQMDEALHALKATATALTYTRQREAIKALYEWDVCRPTLLFDQDHLNTFNLAEQAICTVICDRFGLSKSPEPSQKGILLQFPDIKRK